MKRLTRLLVAIALVVTAVPLLTAAGNGRGYDQAAEHRRTVEFWTHARVAQAVPRDFVVDPAGGGYVPRPGKPPGTPGGGNGGGKGDSGSGVVKGASWNAGGQIDGAEGKVLFELGGTYYVCSATVIDDGSVASNGSALIITAAHCVYDETDGTLAGFSTNWTFIPDYDAAPAPLSTSSDAYCDDTAYGCWTATSIAVHSGYASAQGFNDAAVVHDFAVVRVGPGGHGVSGVDPSQDDELDTVVAEQGYDFTGPETFSTAEVATWAHAFGYPAAQKYKGNDLTYCFGPFDGDPYNDDDTYRLNECAMTGGSSGGGWFHGFDEGTGSGTLFSVNSYGYSGVKAMHGPFLNAATQDVYDLARTLTAGSNGIAS